MPTFLRNLYKDEAGATAIEYGLIAALIAVVLVVALGTLGDNLSDTFDFIADEVEMEEGGD